MLPWLACPPNDPATKFFPRTLFPGAVEAEDFAEPHFNRLAAGILPLNFDKPTTKPEEWRFSVMPM
jgi:hypothetical protein